MTNWPALCPSHPTCHLVARDMCCFFQSEIIASHSGGGGLNSLRAVNYQIALDKNEASAMCNVRWNEWICKSNTLYFLRKNLYVCRISKPVIKSHLLGGFLSLSRILHWDQPCWLILKVLISAAPRRCAFPLLIVQWKIEIKNVESFCCHIQILDVTRKGC